MRTNELIIEGYINYLFDPDYSVEKEWRGNNLPVEHDCKPNWIRECMLLDCDREKIMCLRKLRETTAMNPFYQHRVDRFIDAITLDYDPSGNDGMVPELQESDAVVPKKKMAPEDVEAEEYAVGREKQLPWSKK